MNDVSGLKAGDRHYRAWVGQPERYDLLGALQFNLLTTLGLREFHRVLDIGCGSLRAGRLLIPYLLPGHYCGVEPEAWLIEEATEFELTPSLIKLKQPVFRATRDFNFEGLGLFDYVIAQSIFSHASLHQITVCLAAIRNVIKQDGLCVVNYLVGESDYSGTEWAYPECVSYKPETMCGLVEAAGFGLRHLVYPHPAGLSWILVF
ncbi:MAG TPA: class I SAM-dependent methyltransferase [Blastocatellia bacterium]|nr:class I SAM-dependent methyltransferase [Blastocatellia bacterium]